MAGDTSTGDPNDLSSNSLPGDSASSLDHATGTMAVKRGLAEIRAATDIPIATGESEFTRFAFRDLLELRAADILQPDVSIAGGVTETMRIAALCESAYEWGQHVSMGRDAGLTDAEIEAIRTGNDPGTWTETDRLLLAATGQLHEHTCISPDLWTALSAHYSEQQMLDIIFTVGNYNMLAMALNSIGVELDEDYESY